jgi:hypothetical protein
MVVKTMRSMLGCPRDSNYNDIGMGVNDLSSIGLTQNISS